MLETFTLATFAPLLGSEFELVGRGIGLELLEANTAGSSRGDGPREPFSLVFGGPLEPLLEQRTYGISHPGLGEFDLFVVPIGRDAAGTRYEAVFA